MAYATNTLVLIGIAGGLLPAIFWLWFWLREDHLHPEPARIIVSLFIAGILATALALPAERYAEAHILPGMLLFLAWATIEEFAKFVGAYFGGLSDANYDEPVDAMVYLITVALGFAALENSLFLIKSFSTDGMSGLLLTGNIRFLGATLVHVVSSAIVGGSIALAYYKSFTKKVFYFIVGLCTASLLHALFNFFIIKDSSGEHTLLILIILWFAVVAIFLLFEKIKFIKRS